MKRKLLLVFVMCLCLFVQAFAQEKTIIGKVTSSDDGKTVPGVSIKVKGTSKVVQTGAEGGYSITANSGDVLIFSYLSMLTQEKTVGSANTMNVVLKPEAKGLNEVVVVGFGTQRKANLTGAVSTVDVEKAFGSKPLNDPAKALQGVVPGLTITYGNGGLTSAPNINIRGVGSINGNSQPLILVDNVETPDLSLINPSDIESISVLKDAASTSIYGARAAFGVVLVKTKSGKKNTATSINYNNNFSWGQPTNLPEFANPVEELTGLYNASVRGGTTSPEIFGMQLLRLRDGIDNWQKNYAATNTGKEMILGQDFDYIDGRVYFFKQWDPKKEMLNKYTTQQNHNLRIQGGSEKIGYNISAGYSKDGGIFKLNPDQISKYNLTASITAAATKWLDVDAKFMYRNFNYTAPYSYQNNWYYFWRWGSYFPYGTYNGNYFRSIPAYLANAQQSSVVDNYNRIDLGATIKIAKNLNVRADYTIGRDNALRKDVGGPIYAYDFWSAGTPPLLSNIASAAQDIISYGETRQLRNTFNAYATYQNTFGENHNVKVMAGVNTENYDNVQFTAGKQTVLDPTQAELNLAVGTPIVSGIHGSGNYPVGGYGGVFGRVNYDYKGKYLLEVNGREDASSSFSKKDRWSFFPSASMGYRLTEESFMSFIKPAIDDIKFRASFGTVGNQNVGGQYYIPTMAGSAINWVTPASSTRVQGIAAPIPVAQALTWEKVQTLDLGADIRFWNNHIGVSADWYQRDTKGMLQNTTIGAVFGSSGPKINAGNFRNKGFEVSVDLNYPISTDLNLYSTLTFADNKTKFTKWNNPSNTIYQNLGGYYEGQTYGEIWGFETDGFFSSAEDVAGSASQTKLQTGNFVFGPGDIKYKDLNGDGVISSGATTSGDHGDLKVIGNSQPRYQYGIRLGGNYKEFDFDAFVQGVGKRSYWGIGNMIIPAYQNADILYANQLDYWTPENTDAFYPNPYINNNSSTISNFPTSGNNFYPQTKYLLNLAYARLKNVTLGYTFGNQWSKKYGVQKFRIYVSGQNLATISNVGVPIDPEMTDGESGFTGRSFPFSKLYSFGVNLTL
ncbi:MAG: TonB-dependent receptor [Pedobacter sp.]|jgi:TonB-linked SusC/RagA family outer membrane protein|nr:TonB-dependent receptor [Pedobacter sp.]